MGEVKATIMTDVPLPPRPGAARKPRPGSDTREHLLDAAECLFADHGYDGTSLRDIAERAQLNMALSTYHFGTKERLFAEVIRRRAAEVETLRLAGLDRIDLAALSVSDGVRTLLEAYALPVIQACYGSSEQWQAHVRLISQLVNTKRWLPLLQSNYGYSGQKYLEKFQQLLPDARPGALLDAFSFMTATILYVCSYTNRFDEMRDRHDSLEQAAAAARDNFLRYVHAGFMALESRTGNGD